MLNFKAIPSISESDVSITQKAFGTCAFNLEEALCFNNPVYEIKESRTDNLTLNRHKMLQ